MILIGGPVLNDGDLDWLPENNTSTLDAALVYVDHGFHVVLLHGVNNGVCTCKKGEDCGKSAGKHPVIRGWQEKPNREVVESWYICNPECNVGLVMGNNNVVALDVDGLSGADSLENLLIDNELPETLTAQTGNGRQYLFEIPEHLVSDDFNIENIKSVVGGVGEGLDIRSIGSYIVAAPSIHRSGKQYTWIKRKPIATLPHWLYEKMTNCEKAASVPSSRSYSLAQDKSRPQNLPNLEYRTKLARARLALHPPAISGRGGSTSTLKAAIMLIRGYCLPPEVALHLLVTDYNPRCKPPWDKADLAHKISDAETNSKAAWGYLLK